MPSLAIERPTRADLVKSRFVPTVVYAREDAEFHSRLCVYNYYSELFPEVWTGATVNMWFFNREGDLVARDSRHIGFRGQLQFELAELGLDFEGMAGVSLVPDTLPEMKPKGVGTGFYIYYYDNTGHGDFSHEVDSMRFSPFASEPWSCVVRPLVTPATEVIVVNPYSGDDASAGRGEWTARLRTAQAEVVAEKKMPAVNPRGTARVALEEVFPDVAGLAHTHGVLAFEAKGRNIMAPVTFVTVPGGDFNLHHFC